MRARTEPKIRAAEERARPRALPAAVFTVAGPDAKHRWYALDVIEKRAIVAAFVDVTVLPAGRGHWRFDSDKVRFAWKANSTAVEARRSPRLPRATRAAGR
jgi:hypothetical protein